LFTNLNGLLLMTLQESSAHWFVREFDQLASSQLYAILAARVAVFVVEQDCPYQDIDGLDEIAIHVWAESPEGKLLAYARILPPGRRFAEPAIGRVLTTAAGRGLGIGRALMRRSWSKPNGVFRGKRFEFRPSSTWSDFMPGWDSKP
jgi:ElaA protein